VSRAPARTDRRIALALGLVTFAVLWATEKLVGFVRDESVYFAAAEQFARWWALLFHQPSLALTDRVITQAFDFNHEHPMAMKMLFGWSNALFAQTLHWVRPATGFRLPAFAIAALIPALLHLWGSVLWGRRAGLFAALSFFVVPRHFFHAHLSCFDMPVAAMWLLVVYLFWRAEEDLLLAPWTGVAFGLALATKHNAFFLPVVLAPFGVLAAWRVAGQQARTLLVRWLRWPSPLVYAAPAGRPRPGGLVRTWELLAADLRGGGALRPWPPRPSHRSGGPRRLRTGAAGGDGLLGPLSSPALAVAHPPGRSPGLVLQLPCHPRPLRLTYFDQVPAAALPAGLRLVVTALTVPVSLGVPMAVGLVRTWLRNLGDLVPALARRFGRGGSTEWLLGVNALFSILLISHPDVPHFGGVKHWLPSMPFLALLGAREVDRAVSALGQVVGFAERRVNVLAAVFGILLLLPGLTATAHVHPYGTSAYGELAGGIPGAASLGLQRQYWSNNVTGVLPWINAHARAGERLWLHEVNGLSFRDYQRNGMLRPDVVPAGGPEDADIAAVQYHQEFREQEVLVWQAFGTQVPSTGLYLDETPQVVVYRRPPRDRR
jgi:hypothetical protein